MMKHITLTLILSAAASAAAAGVNAGQVTNLGLPTGSHHPALSPDGSTVLYSTIDHTGLCALDIASGSVTVIDEAAAAGFQPVFGSDGTVYYRTASMVDGLMCRDLRSYSPSDGKKATLATPSRKAAAIPDKVLRAEAAYNHIDLIADGHTTAISPLADAHSYLWASLSPDGSRLLFSEPFMGVYVSRADGSEAKRILAKGDFCSWAGSDLIIAVVSHDDGYVVLDSQLVAVDVTTGDVTPLTPAEVLVSEATASPDGRVVYTDLDGNMFMFDLSIR